MDSRLDLFGALGLDIGDAHLIRNAGGIPTDDVLRSLALSQRALGTREVVIIHHTQCGMDGFDDAALPPASWPRSPATSRPGGSTASPICTRTPARSVQTVRDLQVDPYRDDVRGFIFDVSTATLTEVS